MNVPRFTISALALLPPALWAQGDPNVNRQIINEGKFHNQSMGTLHHIAKNIGARLTSSPALQKACDWTVTRFRSLGLQNVHEEKWGEFPVGFERGPVQVARMIAPYTADFVFTTAAWSPGTNGPLRGWAVYEPTTLDEFDQVKDHMKGAWLVMRQPPARRRFNAPAEPPTPLQIAVDASGILGKVYPSRNELVVTGGNYRITWDKLPTERRITIRKSDWNAVASNLDHGKPVQLEFNFQNRFIRGPVPIYNVVADLVGTEKPNEYVIVSGHLDSWNGPGSEGALDNGVGSTVTLEAARILTRVHARPKRTIRFILWTGEEEGLLGSRAYVQAHPELLPKISAVLVDDGGTNYEGGMDAIASMEPMLAQAQAPMNSLFPDMPFKIRVVPHQQVGIGSDHDTFLRAGVPGFFWDMVGTHDYNFVHHTQHDVYEQAIPKYMLQKTTNSAVMAYNLACADTLLPRDPNPAVTPQFGTGTPRRTGGR
jgi:carboxypeptidase Q